MLPEQDEMMGFPKLNPSYRGRVSGLFGGQGRLKGWHLGAFWAGHWLRPPAVFPFAKEAAELWHDLLGEQLRVVRRQILAHAAELHQKHQVADVEVGRQLGQLLGDLL